MSEADREAVNQIYANMGKAIAAYERQIQPGRTRFDDYVAAAVAGDTDRMAELFTPEEAAGLRLFVGEAQCTNCHNGPLLSNSDFHNIGLPAEPGQSLDAGRIEGIKQAIDDPFNCLGPYSDAGPKACAEIRFARTDGETLIGAFKTPSLRNVANTAPYMHNGIFPDLDAVLAHYNAAPPAFPGHSDLEPLEFDQTQLAQLKAFLHTLSAPPAAEAQWLAPPPETTVSSE